MMKTPLISMWSLASFEETDASELPFLVEIKLSRQRRDRYFQFFYIFPLPQGRIRQAAKTEHK